MAKAAKRKKKQRRTKLPVPGVVTLPANVEAIELSPGELPELGGRGDAPKVPDEPTPLDAARDAADCADGEPEPIEVGAPPPPGVEETLIGLTELVCNVTVHLVAARRKLKWTPELEELAHLSDSERASLGRTTPLAAQYFGSALSESPGIGALIFGVCAFTAVSGRARSVGAVSTAREPDHRGKHETQGEPDSPPDRQDAAHPSAQAPEEQTDFASVPGEEAAHQAIFGAAAPSIDVGTVPRTREFPDIEPTRPSGPDVRPRSRTRRRRVRRRARAPAA